ncbi:PREDICTED: protein polybromo-1 [Nicrophorus vespilloides]|uniref:Protein polybromo-1 n=1 Tax=Nicrophorus vespilloides TaxID=110193 RepID=A0ABM1NJ77_NICVS|nr:PREDICTED: protein polybromo-1 [Nicrophorus vespilloides]
MRLRPSVQLQRLAAKPHCNDTNAKVRMSKRRRTSSIASRGQEEDSLDSIEASSSSGPSSRKRMKKQDPMELVQQIYDSIRNYKKEDGTLLCDAFIRVPKRRQEPRYYEVVSNPIDLLKVQQKLKTDEYEDIDDLQIDIDLIVSNAIAFYKKNSQEFKDACDLWELFLVNKARIYDGKDDDAEKSKALLRVARAQRKAMTPESRIMKNEVDISEDTSESSTNPDEEFNVYEDLFTAIMTATDAENHPLHIDFQLLPSKRKYPEYYEVIENPIDLKTIAVKIQSNEYSTLNDMEKDLLQMTKNACTFNEPGSQIYKNAKALKKIITSKKIEVEHGKYQGGKSSERIRNKRMRASTSLSAVTAALHDESEMELEPDESMEEDVGVVDSDNPKWQLFDTVKSVTTNSGGSLSEPFWRLPSRRVYPDYYREIKNPVCMMQIRRKLVCQSYGTVSEVAGDMTIMFENAKKYNLPSSKLYKDAVKLQKVMQSKVQELLDLDQDTDNEETDNRKKGGIKVKTPSTPAPRGRPAKDVIPLKRRLHSLAKFLLDYSKEDGRKPLMGFMEKPSKKLYPDYYQVITEPIDFLEIEAKIKGEQYSSENELVRDFKLMFSNCRTYNEENSHIYEDATLLEKVLIEKIGQTIVTPERKTYSRVARPKRILTPIDRNCRTLYDTIKDYREPKANRQLSLIFMKLPSKSDYPDYYELIKSPVDMEKISHKVKSKEYDTLEDLVSEFNMMFDNACKYNEPDSQIYKDALVLQKICLQTKLQLKEDDDTVPDVPAAIQDLLLSLFTSIYNHQDVDERCYSDSMSDLPEHDDIDGKKVRALSLDLIKRRLDKGLYRRLDTFQDDFFACLERARQLSRSDSQVFEDSIEMQTFFIKLRDELCRNGELLHSPALNYSLMNLQTSVETVRQSKQLQESLDDENETRSSDDSIIKDSLNIGETMTFNQRTFKVGDFVYLDAKEKGVDPHILLIERLWSNGGQKMLYGNYYLRPAETYHLTTRKFLEKEVFKSDTHVAVPLEDIKERCCVINFKQYFIMKPEGFDEKDVYVCECRYSTKSRSFKRIKLFPESPNMVLVPRETPMEPKRVVSIFRERVEKHKDELAELQEIERLVEKEKPNVIAFSQMELDDGNTYFEQYNTICSGVVKTGDFVYVAADGGRQTIAQIDSIYETKDGKCYFRGPWFVLPSEMLQIPNRSYYRQEMFLSTLEEVNPIVSVVGKCTVLDYNEYISSRPTEIPEVDVYICTSLYDEINRQLQKLPLDGLKKYHHSSGVTEDEIYYFPKLINPLKVGNEPQLMEAPAKAQATILEVESSPMLTKLNDMDILMEDSIDGPPSVGSGELPATVPISGSSISTPATTKKKNKNKVITGYILYSREVRKTVVANNPNSSFGEISRIVGNEWKSLSTTEKIAWEEKASKQNDETKARFLEEGDSCNSPAPSTHPDHIFECCWDTCDYQFEESSDCIEHCIRDKDGGGGHVQTYFSQNPEAELHCLWRGCARIKNKKNSQPFPNVTRLVRHVRDLHINKGNGRVVPMENRSKNFIGNRVMPVLQPCVSTTVEIISAASNTFNTSGTFATSTTPGIRSALNNKTTPAPAVVPQKQHEPLFISVPPRPQRALHSEAYIKYIEGLHADNKYISPWEKTLNASQENAVPDMEKINNASTWLGTKANQQDNVLNALWALRNQLLRDTLGLQKTL